MSGLAYQVYDPAALAFVGPVFSDFTEAFTAAQTHSPSALAVAVGAEHIAAVKSQQDEAKRAARKAAFQAAQDARAAAEARKANEQAQKVSDAEALAQAAKDAQDAANTAASEAGISQPFA